VLGVRIPPRGSLRSDEAGPDLGYPWALVDDVFFPFGHVVVDVAGGGTSRLD
jgi:hypothetical protein